MAQENGWGNFSSPCTMDFLVSCLVGGGNISMKFLVPCLGRGWWIRVQKPRLRLGQSRVESGPSRLGGSSWGSIFPILCIAFGIFGWFCNSKWKMLISTTTKWKKMWSSVFPQITLWNRKSDFLYYDQCKNHPSRISANRVFNPS